MPRDHRDRLSQPTPLPARSPTPPVVGRQDELRRIDQALSQTLSGRGGALFLSGEAGIGKTRLLQEAIRRAEAQGFLALLGRAYPLEGGLAYAPLLEAFGAYLRRLDSAQQSALVRGLPDLGRLFAGLRLPAPEPLGDPALEKTRLFEAVARLLERLARLAPVVLALDDLHWADSASLELLHYLSRGLPAHRVWLLCTIRSEEREDTRGLRRVIQSLQRSGLLSEVALPRLSAAAVASLVRGLLDGEPPRELLALLEARASGTPLFVEALVRACLDSGQLTRAGPAWQLAPDAVVALPASVRAAILDGLERLTAEARQLLALVALSSEPVPHALLRAASGLSDAVLLGSLDELRATRGLAEEVGEREVAYRLTHPLIQEVVAAELAEMARRQAHATLARARDQVYPEQIEPLAYHYREAGDAVNPERALDVFLLAGQRARELHAYDQTAQQLGAALSLVRAGQRVELLPQLLAQLGEACELVGEGGMAVDAWSEALAEYERAGDALAQARVRRFLALAEWNRGHFDAAQAHVAAGLAALAGRVPSEELIDLLQARALALARLGDAARVAPATHELMAVARQVALPRAEAEALLAEALLGRVRGEYVAARDLARRALAVAERAGAPLLVMRAHDTLALFQAAIGAHRLARAHAEQMLALARRLGAPALELLPRVYLVILDLMAGAWTEALARSTESLALARRISPPRGLASTLVARAIVLAHRGALAEAAACVTEIRATYGEQALLDRRIFTSVDLVETMIALERGDRARLQAIMADLVPGSLAAGIADMATANPFVALLLLGYLAESQVAMGQGETALATAQRLAALGPGDTSYSAALAARAEGLAHGALGHPEDAIRCLANAADRFTALAIPFEAARAQLEWAALTSDLDSQRARAAAQESLAVFERLGARRYAERARQLLKRLGVRPAPPRRSRPQGGRLSPRELEVAQLVARGLTTAEIAERLVLSPRTVTTHLERIYARLGLNSRAALTRYLAQADLLPPPDDNT